MGKVTSKTSSNIKRAKPNNRRNGSYSKPSNSKAKDCETHGYEKEGKANDPSWYIREGQLASDVASLSFNTPIGAKSYLVADNPNGTFLASAKDLTLPGIMSLLTVPSPGASPGGFSPINIAAKNIYGIIRSRNSGGKNYDSPDLMLVVLALDSISSLIMHLQRAYGTAMVYSQVNRYVGDGLLKAMGFDPADVRANLAQFRAQINMLIVKFSAFAAPASMSLFRRHAWMYSLVFKDSAIQKSQFYIYRPAGFFRYYETSGGPGQLVLDLCAMKQTGINVPYYTTDIWTIAQWMAYADALMTPLVSSEDVAVICGDIIKAYGEENLFKLALVNEDYTVESVYSEEILDQIHNTTFAGTALRNIVDPTDAAQLTTLSLDSWGVRQDPTIGDGQLIYAPQGLRNRNLGISKLLDMFDDKPTPERVMVATRNMLFGDVNLDSSSAGQGTWYTITSCGSDICLASEVWDVAPNASGAFILRNTLLNYLDNTFTPGTHYEDWSEFYRAPTMYVWATGTSSTALAGFFGNLDNVTIVSRATLDKIHESAMLAMLGVPMHT